MTIAEQLRHEGQITGMKFGMLKGREEGLELGVH